MRSLERKIGAMCRAVAVQVAETQPDRGRIFLVAYTSQLLDCFYVSIGDNTTLKSALKKKKKVLSLTCEDQCTP